MSSQLINRTLCYLSDYEKLLASLKVAKTFITCNDGLADGAFKYYQIICDNWIENNCLTDIIIYIWDCDECPRSLPWTYNNNFCGLDNLDLPFTGNFLEDFAILLEYLKTPGDKDYMDYLAVATAICEMIIQAISTVKSLRKTSLTY